MSEPITFSDRVAIVTGAGSGLGRSHALLLARLGAKVVVNDMGTSTSGDGKNSSSAEAVVATIRAAGGTAVANTDSVEHGARIVDSALQAFGRIDIVVNNAGILRDVTFAKMTELDWNAVFRVHVFGAFSVTHAAWPHLRSQNYGRVVMTTSASGLYGNFGQSNYAAAKMALVGFANALALEGASKNIHVNTIAPMAASRMTESILPSEALAVLQPEAVSPLVAWLCSEQCETTGGIFEAGGGFFGRVRLERSLGWHQDAGLDVTPESIRDQWQAISDFTESIHPSNMLEAMQSMIT